GVRLDRQHAVRVVGVKRVVDGGTSQRLRTGERRYAIRANQPVLDELTRRLAMAHELAAARDRDDDLVRQLPIELLGGLERQRLRAFRIERADVDVAESPGRRLD